jgi:shikimate kinase
MNLVLIGYRCTGKTTIGEILAEKLGWPLVDTDTLVQERAGRSIQEIVEEGGWADFRRREREIIADVAARDRQVISAGGGAVLDEENTRALRACGKVVLLTAAAEMVWDRMKADPKTAAERPNLTDSGGIAEIRNLLAERRPKYLAACHYEIQTDRFSPEETAGRILAWIKVNGDL